MKIERAIPEDHATLTAITKLSKAYWGYTPEQMQDWDALLTITPEYITDNETYKLVSESGIAGYYAVIHTGNQALKLDNFFILPEFIGKGFGKKLMEHLFTQAALGNYTSIILDADPNAEEFYKRFGFITIGKTETSIPNRYLPIMKKLL